MAAVEPRVQLPSLVPKGEVFEVKTLIGHPMETGLRRDVTGNLIRRDLVHSFSCTYNETVVFSAELNEAVAANPFLSFYIRAEESGHLQFTWEEDGGHVYSLESRITVQG